MSTNIVKFFFFANIYLFFTNTCSAVSEVSASTSSVEVLPPECDELLKLFATETANFTLCVIKNARPITMCEKCVNEYNQVLEKYDAIQKLQNNNSEASCRAVLTNIDRLEVIYLSYRYVIDMWEKASCQMCLNGTLLNERSKELKNRTDDLNACITKHTQFNSTPCSVCRKDYDNLINYYNSQKINNEFCMDIIDLINNTQTEWSLIWKCHVPIHNSEWVLLVIAFTVLFMPVLFYFINWLLSQERSNILLSQSRWLGRFTHSAPSTSGYVTIS